MTRRRKSGYAWHVHHKGLIEWCWDYDERVAYIKAYKPANEIPTRLSLLQLVKGKLPVQLQRAGAAYGEAAVACDKAAATHKKAATWMARGKAWEGCKKAAAAYGKAIVRYDKAILKYMPLLEKLHAKECGCSEWDGSELVFPKEAKP